MSEHEIRKASELEDVLTGANKAEISEVTITEYRKSQIVRMGECAIGIGLIGVGAGMTIYNGRNLYMNFKQDGKLIREAIKIKKVEEKKIREERKKASSQKAPDVKSSEPKVEKPQQRESNPTHSNGAPARRERQSVVQNGAVKKVDGASGNGNIKETDSKREEIPLEFTANADIIESAKKEGKEIMATIVEKESVESPLVEAIITSTEEAVLIPVEENGREVVR
jgi:hypothetical protein